MDSDKRAVVAPMIDETEEESELVDRRRFLRGLGKWSLAVITGVALGTVIEPTSAAGWVNTRGSWVNGPGAGGWANRGATWANGGGSWINRGGSIVRAGGGSGVNGGGGGAWVNRRGW